MGVHIFPDLPIQDEISIRNDSFHEVTLKVMLKQLSWLRGKRGKIHFVRFFYFSFLWGTGTSPSFESETWHLAKRCIFAVSSRVGLTALSTHKLQTLNRTFLAVIFFLAKHQNLKAGMLLCLEYFSQPKSKTAVRLDWRQEDLSEAEACVLRERQTRRQPRNVSLASTRGDGLRAPWPSSGPARLPWG